MKQNNSFQILLLAVVLMLSSCAVRTVSITTTKPIKFKLPSHMGKLLVVDRTSSNTVVGAVINNSGNVQFPGRNGENIQLTMDSFKDVVEKYSDLKLVKASERMRARRFRTFFPKQMAWDTVQNLCNRYNTDGMVAFEVFHSSYKKSKKDTIITPATSTQPAVTESYYIGDASVTVGFRIYDPQNKTIINSELVEESTTWNAGGDNVDDKISRVLGGSKTDSIKQLCERVAANYAAEMVPVPVEAKRYIYKKGKKSLSVSEGAEMAVLGNWDEAIKIWEAGHAGATGKDAARLSYNIAVANEAVGDMEKAKEWALRSSKENNTTLVRTYLNELVLH